MSRNLFNTTYTLLMLVVAGSPTSAIRSQIDSARLLKLQMCTILWLLKYSRLPLPLTSISVVDSNRLALPLQQLLAYTYSNTPAVPLQQYTTTYFSNSTYTLFSIYTVLSCFKLLLTLPMIFLAPPVRLLYLLTVQHRLPFIHYSRMANIQLYDEPNTRSIILLDPLIFITSMFFVFCSQQRHPIVLLNTTNWLYSNTLLSGVVLTYDPVLQFAIRVRQPVGVNVRLL